VILGRSFLLFIFFSSAAFADLPSDATPFKLKRVSDGDTIVTSDDTRIRLWGIDTPEKDQPYGNKATKALQSLLRYENLYLETKSVDRYGRTVGVIYTADGEEVNLEMVCDGHAWWYRRYAKKATDYKQCQEDAQKNKRGLWAVEDPVAPWDWRRKK
jgi:micrococcal nuclease